MPIEDSMMLFEYGTPKEARYVEMTPPLVLPVCYSNRGPRFVAGALHMGYPLANNYVYPWMESVVASKTT